MVTRRSVIGASASVATGAIAGCLSDAGTDEESNGPTATEEVEGDGGSKSGTDVGADVAVAAEWNVFRARVHDVLALGIAERFRPGATVAGETLARFEAATGEWGAHTHLEATDRDAYEAFEASLERLRMDALEERDLERTRAEAERADEQLRRAQRETQSHRDAMAFEMALFAARIGDVATLAAAGAFSAAETLAQETDDRWENALVHDEVSTGAPELYGAFEGELSGLVSGAESEDLEAVRESAERGLAAGFDATDALAAEEAVADAAVLSAVHARGWDAAALATVADLDPDRAATIARDTFRLFEGARVHDAVESADRATYEAFEGELAELVEAVDGAGAVDDAAIDFGDAAIRAQFAVAGALQDAPGDGDGDGHGHGHGHDDLEGGPNVFDGVPADADHVVEIREASFEPAELRIATGDSVAFEHVAGEPHTVTAASAGLPAEASYWASGGFEAESAAREGWEEGRGAILEGQAYVRTFEEEGAHEFYCIPHEAAGQTGRLLVERAD